jgi:hypothetical protein
MAGSFPGGRTMADLLTHVLVAYALLTVLSWRIDWLTRRWIAIGIAGVAIPDLGKVDLVVDADRVAAVLDVPFSYAPIGTLFGVLLTAGAIALLFVNHRRRAYAVLVAGGGSALLVDGLRLYADGKALFWLYPVWWRPPTPGWYVSSEPRVLAVGAVVAGVVFALDRWIMA